ncbi:MAG: capsule assembly Wzi family protein [Pseudomonadota bacterium]
MVSTSLLLALPVHAGPWLEPGDIWLKSDVQLLADAGVITSPISSWPLSWGDIAQDINRAIDDEDLTLAERAALARLRQRADIELRVDEPFLDVGIRIAENPQDIRGFADVPRGEQEIWASGEYTGERFAVRLRGSLVNDDPFDDREARADGSYAAVAIGNWMVGASLLDRWWGPGWNGSLILSSSARPIPALVLERNFSTPFESKWLRWIGPWSTSVIWGQLESDRGVPDTRFFGWRVNFKPLRSLEIGLLRTAQWCGDGRQCDLDAFARVLVGDSNLDSDTDVDLANQLAGVDFRWSSRIGPIPFAAFGQFIGEDEAGGFPSRFLGQVGVETWGSFDNGATQWRAFGEFADTTCQFNEESRIFNCAYENEFYPTGYRFRGRSIGYATDADSRSVTLGLVATRLGKGDWSMTVRRLEVNRAGNPQPTHTIAPTPVDITDVDVQYRRRLEFVDLIIGAGAERREDAEIAADDDTLRVFVGVEFRL